MMVMVAKRGANAVWDWWEYILVVIAQHLPTRHIFLVSYKYKQAAEDAPVGRIGG